MTMHCGLISHDNAQYLMHLPAALGGFIAIDLRLSFTSKKWEGYIPCVVPESCAEHLALRLSPKKLREIMIEENKYHYLGDDQWGYDLSDLLSKIPS